MPLPANIFEEEAMEWLAYIGFIVLGLVSFMALTQLPRIYERWAKAPAPIDEARDVAFELTEVSMLERPEDWVTVRSKNDREQVYWLTNQKAGISLWLSGGSPSLHVRTRAEDNRKIVPSDDWKRRLWLAAKTIIDAEDDAHEAKYLKDMVAGFSRLSEEKRRKV
jgi:hypothetical protein